MKDRYQLTATGLGTHDVWIYNYPDNSLVDGELSPLKSPFNEKPGEFVELKTYQLSASTAYSECLAYHFANPFRVDIIEVCCILLHLFEKSLNVVPQLLR